ncbi:MAG: hypothetical protein IJY61_04565 [Candidatus Gastranaerophilales bacterium]|nr:hypothetical protein [Candidatus Gastranaerophilales bacterium]
MYTAKKYLRGKKNLLNNTIKNKHTTTTINSIFSFKIMASLGLLNNIKNSIKHIKMVKRQLDLADLEINRNID